MAVLMNAPEEVFKNTSYAQLFYWHEGQYKSTLGVFMVCSTGLTNHLEQSGQYTDSVRSHHVFFRKGRMSHFLGNNWSYVGSVGDVWPSINARCIEFFYRLLKAVHWDGWVGFSMYTSDLSGEYHACDLYWRTNREREMYPEIFTWWILKDVTEPQYFFHAKVVELRGERCFPGIGNIGLPPSVGMTRANRIVGHILPK